MTSPMLLNRVLGKISEQNRLLYLSFLVGVLSGCAAVVLDWAITAISGLIDSSFDGGSLEWGFLVFPGVGMFISMLLLRYVVRDNIGHGVTKVLLAVSRNESRIKPHNMWSSVLTSSFTMDSAALWAPRPL